MSTGDIKGNIAQLQRCLQHLKYPAAIDDVGLILGDPLAALPVLNFVLLKYSRHVAAYILSKGIQLQGKTDEGFVKHAFRLFRDHLGLRVIITPAQFLEQGFAERKVLLLVDVVKAARHIHQAGVKQERIKVDNAFRQSPGKLLQGPSSSNSPVTASVQLYASQPVPEQLRKVPAGATDAAQELFELINPEEPDLAAAAIAILTSPVQLKPSHHKFSARQSSPTMAAQAAGGAGSNRGRSPIQRPGSTSHQEQLLQARYDDALQEGGMLEPRGVLPKPAHQFQRRQQLQQLSGGLNSNSQDQLIAAGLMPLPREAIRQQQEQQQLPWRRPLKACLWPQPPGQNVEHDIPAAAAAAVVDHEMVGDDVLSDDTLQTGDVTGSSDDEQQQQRQDEELMSTTTLMPAPQRDGVPAAKDGLESAHAAPVQEMQQQLLESQAVVADLQQRLTQAEQQLREHRSAAAGFQESAAARITLLEGRLKFLENLFNTRQQQGPTAAGGQDSSNRSRTSIPAPDVTATRSSRSYMPATNFTERCSQPTSPATVHTTSVPRYSPGRRAAAAAASAATASSMDWRSAASAAAAAVVAGLTASPLKSPLRSSFVKPDRGSAGCLHACSKDDLSAEYHSWQGGAVKMGLRDSGLCTTGNASPHIHQQQQAGASESAPAEHTAEARMADFAAYDAVRSSYSRPSAEKGPVAGATRRGGNAGHPEGCSKPAAEENGDMGTLIDKLASRAVAAAAMLEAFRAGNMA